MTKELETVISFCLQHAESSPVLERVFLYRGLAEFCGNERMAAEFCRMADDLMAAEKRCKEFHFEFKAGGKIAVPQKMRAL